MTGPQHAAAPLELGDLDEEEILARILPLLRPTQHDDPDAGPGRDRTEIVGPGDDAAVLAAPDRLIVTTDSMIRGRDWRDDWSSPRDVATKLGAQNISDIAAMGGTATGAVLTITAHAHTPFAWVAEFSEGLGQWCADAGVTIVGGDLSSAPEGVLQVSLTMWGTLEGRAPVLRSGARVGDVVAVCGSLGWSDAGLASYLAGEAEPEVGPGTPAPLRNTAVWRWFHRSPRPPWESGPVAARAGATSMIDLSDGLVRDTARIARASGVGMDLSREALARDFVSSFAEGRSSDQAWQHVLGGGEEHSLLATFPSATAVPRDEKAPWWVIGSVVEGAGVTLDGEPVEMVGWDHFRTDRQ